MTTLALTPRRGALAGIGLMLAGVFLFSVNDAVGKWLLTTYSVRRDLEWARITRDLFGDARAVGVVLTAPQRREVAEVFASVNATDESAVEAYEPPFLRAEGREVPDWLEHLLPA